MGHGTDVTLYHLDTYEDVGRIYGDKFALINCFWSIGGTGTFDTLVTVAKDRIKMWNYNIGACKLGSATEVNYIGAVAHSQHNYLCGWSKKNVHVFKLLSERPVMVSHLHHLYYVKHGTIRHYNADKEKESVLFKLTSQDKGAKNISLDYNPTEHSLLLNYSSKHGAYYRDFYQLFVIIDGVVNGKPKTNLSQGRRAVWAAHNRFAHLDDLNQLIVKNLDNKNVNFAGFTSGFLLPKSSSTRYEHKLSFWPVII